MAYHSYVCGQCYGESHNMYYIKTMHMQVVITAIFMEGESKLANLPKFSSITWSKNGEWKR